MMENNDKSTGSKSFYGSKKWFMNNKGEYHRENGPALECFITGDKFWYKHGIKHRLDGPAHIENIEDNTCDNMKIIRWFINGCEVTSEINSWAEENDIDLDDLTETDKALIKLVWADYGK